MTPLAKQLAERFGKDNVRVCTPYHIQVRQPQGGKSHNIHVNRFDEIKVALAGHAKPKRVKNAEAAVAALVGYQPKKSDLEKAIVAIDMATLVNRAERIYRTQADEGREVVLVDAGWKDGLAKIGFVAVKPGEHGPSVSAGSWFERTDGSYEAEVLAIQNGLGWHPSCVVYSDCQHAVNAILKEHPGRIQWLSRDDNRAADKIANRR